MTPEERAEKLALNIHKLQYPGIFHVEWNKIGLELIAMIATEIRQAVEEAEIERAAKQAVIHGESVMLGGRLISNEEMYKQPTDYIKEAKAEAYEDAAKMAGACSDCNGNPPCDHCHSLAQRIRSRSEK